MLAAVRDAPIVIHSISDGREMQLLYEFGIGTNALHRESKYMGFGTLS